MLANFPAEWADPTNKIVRVLLIAFGVVVAFPYLPASDSPAFAGVSVFIGVLFSLSSSSALSNMIAGIVLTYTGAFRFGDRVKLGDAFGDIIETSLLATRVRTIKNEDITIPTASCSARRDELLARREDARSHPPHERHDRLRRAVAEDPRTAHRGGARDARGAQRAAAVRLADRPERLLRHLRNQRLYARHRATWSTSTRRSTRRIQDAFYAAGVEIMSPHYTSLRDGNTVAIPEAFRSPDYRPSAFRVENTSPQRDPSGKRAEIAPSG